MPLTASSTLCNRDSARPTVCERRARLSASVSIYKTSASCFFFFVFFLFFFNVNRFSFIRSTDVRCTKSREIKNRYDANVSPCKTTMTLLKKLLSLSGKRTIVFLKHHYSDRCFHKETIR